LNLLLTASFSGAYTTMHPRQANSFAVVFGFTSAALYVICTS
jgi:hypothetical protein